MSPAAPIEPTKKTLPESSSSAESSPGRADLENNRGFRYLRGVQWRIDLGILPSSSSSSSSIDDLRRVTANSRRSYASLRRRLLIDPHIPKDGSNFPDLVMDNPLSQNPDSMWGRFFHKAELEKMVDQDLSRLYPEHGSYFQTPGCQGVLRRILLLWCIRHPNYGYRQGMHELLAPLVYVLQADVERLSEVRKLYPDYFTDNFDGLSLHGTDSDSISNLDKVSPDDIGIQKDQVNIINNLNELDPKIQTIISFSDAYGAEGELGIVLSEKFMEHDAYCMFDALMDGSGGAVAMANFFSHSPLGGLQNGIPPVLEASSALYHLLSIVDSSLYTHLVQLGVEPQYFALRWLRVLFGREFTLDNLLVIWDEIFALDNKNFSGVSENESEVSFAVLKSCRGAFISALAVSMILYLRSSILATENAASCLQRLLNFPEDVNLRKLMKKAKSLVGLATGAISSIREPVQAGGAYEPIKPVRGQSLPSDPAARGSPHSSVPDSYWEEKWRVMHREEQKQVSPHKQIQNRLKSWSQRVKMRLSRTQSAQSCSNVNHEKVDPTRSSARRNLLDDLGRQLGSENQKLVSEDECKERFSSVNGASEENSSIFSEPISPRGFQANTNNDHENDTERRSVTSNSSVHKTFPQRITAPSPAIGLYNSTEEVASPLPLSDAPENTSFSEVHNEDTPTKSSNETQNEDTTRRSSNETQNEDTTRKSLNKTQNEDTTRKSLNETQNEDATRKYLNEIHHNEDNRGKPETNLKEKRLLSGKFQWLWMFAKTGAEGSSEKGESASEATGSSVVESDQKTTVASSSTIESTTQPETLDRNNNVSTLKNLAQSMLENIQVIESVFQQDKAQMETVENMSKNDLVGRGQITAMAALKELRKISNILSEM